MYKTLKTKIMVFGTFDILHKGHLNFFKQARSLSDTPFLVVSVARDCNVNRIKGRLPKFNESIRLKNLKKLKSVDKVVLGGKSSYLPHIIREKPEIIAIGYDQKEYVRNLKMKLKENGFTVKVFKLKAYKPNIYKSSLVKAGGSMIL